MLGKSHQARDRNDVQNPVKREHILKNGFRKIGSKAGEVAGQAATNVRDAASGLSNSITAAMPSKETLKRGLGMALITGGKLLIDPRAAVGEMAITLGNSLVSQNSPEWLVLEATETAFLPVYRGNREQCQAEYEKAVQQGKIVILSQVVSAHGLEQATGMDSQDSAGGLPI